MTGCARIARSYELRIDGTVQGVGFRHATEQEARRLGLAGWVRNESDGSVFVHAEGPSPALEEFIQWCHEGPDRARVAGVSRHFARRQGLKGFATRA